MKLSIIEPSERGAGPILICDARHGDIAEFFHNEHSTVAQSYEQALTLAQKFVSSVASVSPSLDSILGEVDPKPEPFGNFSDMT